MKKILSAVLILISTIVSAQKHYQKKPKLVIGIVIEQMRYDYLERYWNKFGNYGFKKLVEDGVLCKNVSYNHLITESAPGYATIVTGTTPSFHGIIADQWFLELQNKLQPCVDDEKRTTIGTATPLGKKSPIQLITSTIGDELRLSNFKNSKVISISMKDYAAILSGGVMANAAYWYDNKQGMWISSNYYQDTLPAWVRSYNFKFFPDIYLNREWNMLYLENEYNQCLPDKNAYEIGFPGNLSTFPYNLPALKNTMSYNALNYLPFGNTFTKDFAINAIINENLGKDQYTDFLFIGFSSVGNISNLFGIRSIEIADAYLRLDEDLAHLINALDELVGKDEYLIYLTSDRGAGDHPMLLKEFGMTGNFYNIKSTLALLKSYLRVLYGPEEWIKGYYDHQIYLNRFLIEDRKLSLSEIQEKTALFLVQFTGINNAISADALRRTNFTSGIYQKFQNSYNMERSGDILISFSPGWIEKADNEQLKSVSEHISPYIYDSHVPLIWYGWKLKNKEINRPISVTDIAPTIANILNIVAPNAATGSIIWEMKD